MAVRKLIGKLICIDLHDCAFCDVAGVRMLHPLNHKANLPQRQVY